MDLNTAAGWANIIAIPVAIFFGIVAIVLAIVIYRLQRQRKEAVCFFDEIVAPIEVKAGDALRGDIRILYKDRPVENIFVVRANVVNRGNLSIRKEDIIERLSFQFRPGVELLRDPQIIKRQPEGLKVTCEREPPTFDSSVNVATVKLTLFRPKDSFTVEMLCTGPSSYPEVVWEVDAKFRTIDRPQSIAEATFSTLALAALEVALTAIPGGGIIRASQKSDS
jgi:hypothetical protein